MLLFLKSSLYIPYSILMPLLYYAFILVNFYYYLFCSTSVHRLFHSSSRFLLLECAELFTVVERIICLIDYLL